MSDDMDDLERLLEQARPPQEHRATGDRVSYYDPVEYRRYRDRQTEIVQRVPALLARLRAAEAEREVLQSLIRDMVEWNHLYGYPRGDEWDALEQRAERLVLAGGTGEQT